MYKKSETTFLLSDIILYNWVDPYGRSRDFLDLKII